MKDFERLFDTPEKKAKAYVFFTFVRLIWPLWIILGVTLFFILLILEKT
jgi:hypothetical protein